MCACPVTLYYLMGLEHAASVQVAGACHTPVVCPVSGGTCVGAGAGARVCAGQHWCTLLQVQQCVSCGLVGWLVGPLAWLLALMGRLILGVCQVVYYGVFCVLCGMGAPGATSPGVCRAARCCVYAPHHKRNERRESLLWPSATSLCALPARRCHAAGACSLLPADTAALHTHTAGAACRVHWCGRQWRQPPGRSIFLLAALST